jgi:hypothetical protein
MVNKHSTDPLPIILQFYDWFLERTWVESEFFDPLDFNAIGVFDGERTSEIFYRAQFDYIRGLGVTGISWQFNVRHDRTYTHPSAEALLALSKSGLKICPFLDLELMFKILNEHIETKTATLTTLQAIRPDDATINILETALKSFVEHVPSQLLAKDRTGREIVFVFGYGFERAEYKPDAWTYFANTLVEKVSSVLKHPVFYWSFANAPFLEHLLLHHRDHFCTFHFVLDTPQAQFGHDCVTWNFGFDNLGVAKRDKLERVVRNDLRYYKEMGWLAAATNPSVLFVYSWNEPFEGSMLFPSQIWGDTKSRLAKCFIERLRNGFTEPLPKTLVIINDLDEAPEDWHTKILREIIWYPLRRLSPQSDLRTVAQARDMDLSDYRYLIDFSVRKDVDLSMRLKSLPDSSTVMFTHPFAPRTPSCLCDGFAKGKFQYKVFEKELQISNQHQSVFFRDDVVLYEPSINCKVYWHVLGEGKSPLISQVQNRIWLNAFSPNDNVLSMAFSVLYGRPMAETVMYGEGRESQRLHIDVNQSISEMRFSRKSVNLHWPLPSHLNLVNTTPEVPEEYSRFIFGLDP